jgi:prolyl-tRNA editing enzyme YbaK/EbsC (Cys-tRNA(Pro) deacylase)
LGPAEVAAALEPFGLADRIGHFDQTTFSSEDAARAIGCEVGQIAKSICLMVNGSPVLVVASGDQTVFDRKIADYYGVGRKKVKIARAEECVELFGYAPGGVPPVGLRTPDIPVIIDENLARWTEVHAAAGTAHDNFTLSFEELKRISAGTVLDCTKP